MTLVICPELMRKYLWGEGVNRPLKRALGGQWPKKFEKHCSKGPLEILGRPMAAQNCFFNPLWQCFPNFFGH